MDHSDASRLPLERLLELALSQTRERRVDEWPVLKKVLAGESPAILYPAARMSRAAAVKLQESGVQVLCFGDSNPALRDIAVEGLKVLGPDQIASLHRDVPVLVASTLYDSSIIEMLTKKGCSAVIPVGILNLILPNVFVSREYSGTLDSVRNPANHSVIRQIFDSLGDESSRKVFADKLEFYVTGKKSLLDGIRSDHPIYFDQDITSISRDEVMVDGGAYTGDTLRKFLSCSSGRFRSYYAFEPDAANSSKLESVAMPEGERVECVRAGLARRTGQLRFISTAAGDARLLLEEEPGGETVDVVSLDEFFTRKPHAPTFIKMDIEGAESEALQAPLA